MTACSSGMDSPCTEYSAQISLKDPKDRMTSAVRVLTTVSRMTPSAWEYPCLTGWETGAMEEMLVMVPTPASLERTPRLIPMRSMAPMPPPTAEGTFSAYWKIMTNALITPPSERAMHMAQTMSQTIPMAGTMAVESFATRVTPPKMTYAVMMVSTMAMAQVSNPKAPLMALDMLETSIETNPRRYISTMMNATIMDALRRPRPLAMLYAGPPWSLPSACFVL